ncbi:MAG: 50S ribosomal protein L37ae [Candidatus Aenigmatarchaeota archaeon]|nr:MAG: 50S ribosomal protein L37ae [Candidatus Aenigmarchaeota archaeon]
MKASRKFGPRYGKKIRDRYDSIKIKKSYECPNCFKNSLKRVASGIWECKSCGFKFAGKAYKPR